MKKSINHRLFIGISGLIIFFVTTSWLLNIKYLKPYYTWQKEKSLRDSKLIIDAAYSGNPDDMPLELEKMEHTLGLHVTILGSNFEEKYDSSRRFMENMFPSGIQRLDFRPPPEPWAPSDQLRAMSRLNASRLNSGGSIIEITHDPRLGTDFLCLFSLLNNGDYILLGTPLTAIQESAWVANQFFMITGSLTILLGIIIAFVYANRFARPILLLNDIAQRMSRLDFSKKYNIRSDDEIGELGRSINSLSDQLDSSINKLKETNRKLTEDIEYERKMEEMRKEFVSSVSHELKTPITLIQGYAEGLRVNVNEDEGSKNFYCDVIMDETAKMDKLVKDLLDLSRIESGYFKLERVEFNLAALLDQVLEKYRPIFSEKGIGLNIEKEAAIPVNGDIIRIEQVLTNYINNAINHLDDRKQIKISVTETGGKVRVAVFNSGKHIEEEFLDKIWTSFYKVDKARTRDYGGTGLGLSIVRAIQEQHYNGYGVFNRREGVEFWFEVDASPPTAR